MLAVDGRVVVAHLTSFLEGASVIITSYYVFNMSYIIPKMQLQPLNLCNCKTGIREPFCGTSVLPQSIQSW